MQIARWRVSKAARAAARRAARPAARSGGSVLCTAADVTSGRICGLFGVSFGVALGVTFGVSRAFGQSEPSLDWLLARPAPVEGRVLGAASLWWKRIWNGRHPKQKWLVKEVQKWPWFRFECIEL